MAKETVSKSKQKKTYTDSADIIKVTGSNNTVNTMGGDDEITLAKGKKNKIDSGAGADTIIIGKKAGAGNYVFGGADSDIITVSSDKKNTLRGGTGSDKYVFDTTFNADTNVIIDQADYKKKDADILQLSKVSKKDIHYSLLDGTLTVKHKSGGEIAVSGWKKNPLSKIVFKDGSITGAKVTKNAVSEFDWVLGSKVNVKAAALTSTLQINGYKSNDFVATLNSKGALVLRDAEGGALTVTGWNKNKVGKITFNADGYKKSFTAAAFKKQIFKEQALKNSQTYSAGAGVRQEFGIKFSTATKITVNSASGTEDRIRFTNDWPSEREDLFVNGNDLVLLNWDAKKQKDAGGELVIKNFMKSSVKTIEFSDMTYHLVTKSGTYAGSDTFGDRFMILDGVKNGNDPAKGDWNITLTGLKSNDWIDLRALPNNSRYYSLSGTADGKDMVLKYNYAVTALDSTTLGTLRLKDFFKADGTVNTADGYLKVRINREFYAGEFSDDAFDGLVWDRVRATNGEPEKYYRRAYLNAGTAKADKVDLGKLKKPNSNMVWMYYAGDGNDTVTAQAGDIVYGGNGNDTLRAAGRMTDIRGGAGDDTIYVRSKDDSNPNLDRVVARGETGNDIIHGNGSYLYLSGNSGDDEIHIFSKGALTKNSFASGGYGSDTITIHAGNSHRINGGKDDDKLYANLGSNHILTGGEGNDEIHIHDDGTVRSANNRANGGLGDDKLYIENGGQNHRLFGNAGDDTLSVDGSENDLSGDDGNDKLIVVDGTFNTLYGRNGDDTLTVNGGNNLSMEGGSGSDTYVINTAFTAETSVIIYQDGFMDGDKDVLQLTKVNKGEALYSFDSDNDILSISNTEGGTISIGGWTSNPLDRIIFANGEVAYKKDIDGSLS